ncbi:MAG: Ig-like domain-containing protein [Clostridiales bacterium]|nr:Ig-like domain-containing protein [Clostridiales bacterium]
MTKLWKKLSVICLLLCLALFAGALAACDDDEPEIPQALTYSVTVHDENGAAVSGVKVKFGNFTETTGSDGKASMLLETGDYTISLSGLPEGYTYSQDIKLTAETREVIATLVKGDGTPPPVVPVDPNAPREYRVTVLYPDGTPVTGINVQFCVGNLCLTPIDVNTQGQASMTRKPDNYHVKINNLPAGYTYPQNGDGYYTEEEFSATKLSMTITLVSTAAPQGSVTEAKNTGTYDVTLNGKGSYATVNFAPSLPGEYEISSLTNEYDPMVGYYSYIWSQTGWNSLENEFKNDNVSETDKNFKYAVKIYTDQVLGGDGKPSGIVFQFRIFLNDKKVDGTDVEFPATFQVKIERIGDANRRAINTKDATLTATLSQFEAANGRTSKSVAMDGSAQRVFNKTDGFYHLNSVDGPIVMVLLTKPCKYLDRELTEMDAISGNMGGDSNVYIYDETPAEIRNDESKPLQYVDYRLILRGRKAYMTDGQKPSETAQEYYTKYVNADGYYGLTKDLEKFLKGYVAQNGSYIKGQTPTATQEDLWLFACYYYE